MKDTIVIGGGASGLVAAIYAAKNSSKVILLEKNKNLGKKILITGNGKCNYWNEDQDLKHYNTNNSDLLLEILSNSNQKEILSFFDALGIIPKIRNGYYYPYSGQATSIQTALIKELEFNKVEVMTNCEVTNIEKVEDIFKVTTTIGTLTSKKVILSTGSYACPKTGSTGTGYQFAKSLGHNIIKPLPALVGLKANETYLKEWHGIRSDVSVTLLENNIPLKTEIGEIQLTNYGLSGICIFNLSSLASRSLYNKKNIKISINFLHPFSINNKEEFIPWMTKRNNQIPKRTISDLLDGLLNYKLINLILKLSKIKRELSWDELNINQKQILANNLTNFTLNITETNSFESSQTTTGGIPLSEINPNTMESKKTKDFYMTGELLDVDGECGGYNLTFAWITGLIAGRGINND